MNSELMYTLTLMYFKRQHVILNVMILHVLTLSTVNWVQAKTGILFKANSWQGGYDSIDCD